MARALEQLIYDRLRSSDSVTKNLAKFAGESAVFYQIAPDDKQHGWKGAEQYPRVVFDLDLHADAERKSAGVLTVTVLCTRDGIEPETIEPLVRGCLKDILITPECGVPYCFAWARTDAFRIDRVDGGAAKREVIGQEIRFDVLEFPTQETLDPDPISAMNKFLAETYPNAAVLGLARLGEFTTADAQHPALYCRLQGTETDRATNTVTWMEARIAVHVICSDSEVRTKLAADISNTVADIERITMLDGSPMRLLRLRMDNTADYLKDGQIFGQFSFGILRSRVYSHPLNHPYTEYT